MTPTTTRAGLLGAMTTLLLFVAAGGLPTRIDTSLTPAQLDLVRTATEAYLDPAVALADGYVPAGECESGPDGIMGQHWVNAALVDDGLVDPSRPEVLLYLPDDGGAQLLGVEYLVPAVATGGRVPDLFGIAFDGPMDGHAPGMPEHYDLHVWAHYPNPDGLVAPWNAALTCPV